LSKRRKCSGVQGASATGATLAPFAPAAGIITHSTTSATSRPQGSASPLATNQPPGAVQPPNTATTLTARATRRDHGQVHPVPETRQPEIRPALVNDDHTIVATYGSAYRVLVNYYLLAGDVWRLSRVHWAMATSMLKTLACKHRSTVSKTAARYQATTQTPHGPRKCFQTRVERAGRKPLIATFGGLPLKRQRNAVISDHEPARATTARS
jgi:Type II intron maturase